MEDDKPRSRRKSSTELRSYALDNARERLEAYHAAHAEVIDEYIRLKGEVKGIRIQLGMLEHSLKGLCRSLKKVYEKESGRTRQTRSRHAPAEPRA